jgi:branched-chain amino acid transport system permease protein
LTAITSETTASRRARLARLGRRDIVLMLVVLAGLIAAPIILPGGYVTSVLTLCGIYAIWGVSWDFFSGLTGRENFGHSLFIGAGAYAAAYISIDNAAPPWVSIPLSGLVAACFALVVGIPTLRLKGPYFSLAMLSASAIMQRLALIFWETTGGEEGLYGIEPIFANNVTFYYLVIAVLVLTTAILVGLAASPWGVILRAIRGDEAACEAAGIGTTFYKIAALLISAFFAGIGGALYAHYQLQVSPSLFAVTLSITIITMVYVGGMGSIYGAIGGTFALTIMTESLRQFGEFRLLAYAIVLGLALFFLPNGLFAPLWRRLTGRRAA